MSTTKKFEMETEAKIAHRRAIKREASRRCRARAKLIQSGQLLPAELMVRSAQPKARFVENYKVDLGDKQVRLNRNGGEKVALVITEGSKRQRKSFKDINTAIKRFAEVVTQETQEA